MSSVRHPSVFQHVARNTRSIPSSRISKARVFVALSDRLNNLKDEYAVAHEAVDGLMTILDACAGLIIAPSPVDLLYSKYQDRSEVLTRFERTLNERGETVLTIFSLEPLKRIHNSEGLTLIPLTWQGRTIGLVAFDREGRMMTANDEAMLLSLCNQLAAILALKHHPVEVKARLNSVVRQAEINDAVTMQQSLLPAIPESRTCGLSITTHTQSAEYIGGDYFDLMLVDQNKMGIVIADVEGKGVPAALFGNMLRTTIHFLARETPSTASVVGKINSILHKEAVAFQKLFTLFYSVYDSANKVLTYTGSGHVDPIVVRCDNEKSERLRSDGTLIGIDPIQRFSERSVQLSTGDLVAFFTDGLIEHQNKAGQAFGEQRLLRLLQAHKTEAVENIMRMILAELTRFTPELPKDDLTIILAKIL